jgi:FKBP-type peptidyl-prolyl cis-trans isomerase FkpA
MNSKFRTRAAVLSLATVAFLAACNKPADKDAAAAADAPAKTEADAKDDSGLKIAGLPTDKEQASYMIGMRMAKQLEPIKDEVNVDTIARAIKSALAAEKMLMTEEQATQVEIAFGERVSAKRMAEQMAKARTNAEAGPKFLAENAKKPGVQTTASGLQYQVVTEGKGAKPKETDVVRVHYKGTDLDGKTFDSSYDRGEPAMIPLAQVVPGWREGILMMPIGSKYKLWIPAKLAYGENPPPGAPFGPNATLAFEVELLDVVQPPKPEAQ